MILLLPFLLVTWAAHHRWSPVQMQFVGPQAHEAATSPNPFLDLRLTLFLTSPSGKQHEIPGFFDGDGQGGPSGKV
jgi:hypothetical protein